MRCIFKLDLRLQLVWSFQVHHVIFWMQMLQSPIQQHFGEIACMCSKFPGKQIWFLEMKSVLKLAFSVYTTWIQRWIDFWIRVVLSILNRYKFIYWRWNKISFHVNIFILYRNFRTFIFPEASYMKDSKRCNTILIEQMQFGEYRRLLMKINVLCGFY